jgi:hypothetical protein
MATDDKVYTLTNAVIDGTMLGVEDHGIFTGYIYFTFGGSAQGAGGRFLDTRNEDKDRREGTAYGMQWIMDICKTVGVSNWEDLKGKRVYILHDAANPYGMIEGIANISDPENRNMIFDHHAKEFLT